MKIQTAFRIDEALLELVKEKAKRTNRSLNNYIEYLLYKDVGYLPNQTTIDAINEVHSGKKLTSIDNLEDYKQEILKSKIIALLEETKNVDLIEQFENIVELSTNEQNFVAKTVQGELLTKEEYINKVKSSLEAVRKGDFSTVEEFEQEAKNW